MKALDLFSGIGGFSLGLGRAGITTIAFCEIEEYPRKILRKHWPETPIARDIKKLSYNYKTKQLWFKTKVIYVGTIELICGGFPCQPFSVAGKQGGKEDDRHLWPQMFRLIKEVKPNWIIGENVAGFISMALDDVLSDLESKKYEAQSFVIPACAVGGIHRRDRVWIVANSNNHAQRLEQRSRTESKDERPASATSRGGENITNTNCSANGKQHQYEASSQPNYSKRKVYDVADSEHDGASTAKKSGSQRKAVFNDQKRKNQTSKSKRVCPPTNVANSDYSKRKRLKRNCREVLRKQKPERHNQTRSRKHQTSFRPIKPPTQPPVRHRDDGLSDNVARLKALGNAVVPQIPELIGRAIMEITQ